ncbi:MAG: hypothetical protein UW27_C0010G0024 [Parcubacteria group bacterium GW2011_GWA1_44_13]|uniref:Uncharacterized protein n=1 Tax=Candidatus Nomurabacteria bacterium GW2011_GWB1_44_12 TaxID=1618748 RepID=A0A837IAJ5_9BACT|nr:MAG: hypothetical protein UW25_C0004G0300 [Candidatus Nomurabacteria bacterium GW2011_GWB1_44_12]KKT37744.1 MAG: hypothetical protein UW27_C0010G0024 [Parcubacteria group bacterium GW2011_GWA1_44_13]KKT59172.1 MAG: hypothetical protein UW54_C0033G0007 [Parcubacteria group bacterium GW2011_GWC1_44_26]HBB43971.1 hypothetical protein [Candidatus Yonathbacteria bacterium]
MFENFPTTEKAKPTQEAIRASFENKENEIIKKGTDFLENLEPEKFKNKVANLLLAFSLFAGASTAFAGEQNIGKENLPSMGEEQAFQVAEKNKIAGFDWGKISVKISGENREIKGSTAENIENGGYRNSEFYKGTTSQEVNNALSFIGSTISSAQNYSQFINKLATSQGSFSEKQKAIMLQQVGQLFGETYNYDMLASGDHVKISEDAMLQALKTRNAGGTAESGICGNIHNAQMEIAKSLGIEHTWLQSGSTRWGGQHIWTEMILGDGAERKIAFYNYGELILTDTDNYAEAMGVMERYNESVSIFNNYASNGDWMLQPVESSAQKVMKSAAGIEESTDILKHNLEEGKIMRVERGIDVSISPETKELEINTGTIGLSVTNYKNIYNDPYQSLNEMTAVGGNISFGNEKFGAKVGATILNTDINALSGESVVMNTIVGMLEANYVDEQNIIKGEYGELTGRVGANIIAAVSQQIGSTEGPKASYTEGMGEGSTGGTLSFVNPDKTNEIFISATAGARAQTNNFEEQDLVFKKTAENFVVGAKVKVFEGKVINMELGKSNFDWGKSSSLKVGFEGENFNVSAEHRKEKSDYGMLVPSSEKNEMNVSYKAGPKMKISFFGAKTTNKYQGGQDESVISAGAKLEVLVW